MAASSAPQLAASQSVELDLVIRYERETEYFGFAPAQFLNTLGQLLISRVERRFEELRVELPTRFPHLSEVQCDQGLAQWAARLETVLDRNFELFEAYTMRNILKLPPNYVLPYLRDLDLTMDAAAAEALDGELGEKMKGLRNATYIGQHLQREIDYLEQQEAALKAAEEQLSAVKSILESHHMDPLEKTVAQINHQLGQLKEIVSTTLDNCSVFLTAAPIGSGKDDVDAFYEHLLREAAQDPAIFQQQVEQEFHGCTSVATLADLQDIAKCLA